MKFVIQLASTIIAALAAIAAWRSADAAARSATETKDAAQAQLMADLLRDYSSAEMLDAMNLLVEWKDVKGSDFARKFGELRKSNYEAVKTIDHARRRISHHCQHVYEIHSAGLLDQRVLDAVASRLKAEFYCEYVEPLEAAVNDNWDKRSFIWFADLRSVRRYPEYFPVPTKPEKDTGLTTV